MIEDFKWTDELVLEFVRYTKEDAPTYQGRYADLKLFKQSKQNSNKDWEIVAYRGKNIWRKKEDGRFHGENELLGISWKEGEFDSSKIYSVRRISDNEVFSVGDKIKGHGEFPIIEITRFEINYFNKDEISAYNNNGYGMGFRGWVKAKQKLFTTEDGKDIYEGDWAFYIEEKNNFMIVSHSGILEKRPYKYFSTEAAAKDYIVLNKPCLSLSDVDSCVSRAHTGTHYEWKFLDEQKLKKLVNEKTNDSNR